MDSLSRLEQSITFAASDIWQAPHLFQKRNQQLWIELDRVKKFTNSVTKVTVRAVIPESRLACYVDSAYDVERELAYLNAGDAPQPAVKVSDATEPWMLPEVEELCRKFVTPTRVLHSVSVAQWMQKSYPSLVKKCQRFDPDAMNVVELPCLELCNLKELELHLRITSTRKFWAESLPLKKPNLPSPFLLSVFDNNGRQKQVAEMTTAKMRPPPLRPLNGRSSSGPRGGKRKSAVELLQETKAFYVKSETVRDRKQEFIHTRSPDSCVMAPSQPAKSPRCSQQGSELQDRLRLLLDVDSKENVENRYARTNRMYRDSSPYRGRDRGIILSHSQHKSLPDLHLSPGHSSSDSSESSYDGRPCGDARSAYSSGTQPGYGGFTLYSTKSSDFRRPYGQSDTFSGRYEFPVPDPRVYASLRVTKSGELVCSRGNDTSQTQQYWRRNSNTSSGNRSQHNSSSRHSQSADSGRQSQVGSGGLRTGRSGLPEVISPPPLDTGSDSGAEDGSPPLYRTNSYDKDKRRPILRSKSDTAYRYCPTRPSLALPSSPILTTDQLERFFDHLGMDPVSYRELATIPPRTTSPVFFSSVSSMDSCRDLRTWAVAETATRPPESLSVVERNARIIKWLCNCRKAQMAELTLV